MKLHEYQAKEILSSLGVSIPRQVLARTADEARVAAESFPSGCVVKAQVHSGGRGKAGGVIVCDTPDEAFEAADRLIGSRLYTKQNAGDGLYIPAVLVTEKLKIEEELYLGLTIDTERLGYMVIASRQGGMDIEDVAENTPDQLFRMAIADEIKGYHVNYLADKLGLNGDQRAELDHILRSIHACAREKDATLIEINPLAIVDGHFMAADAKITFDDNALYRHPELRSLDDMTQIDPLEARARGIDLSYVRLQGNIACMVNGAGLAMATVDIIKSYGGEPADFMDVGGGVGTDKVRAAFEIITADRSVKSIFVNIFGGIVRCDVIAQGIVDAAKAISLSIPLVVRLRGNHEREGKAILNDSGLRIVSFDDFTEAAKAAVSFAHGG